MPLRKRAVWFGVRTVCSLHNCTKRGVAVHVVQDALILAAARRLTRAAGVPPLAPIRSLAYFLPVIEEVMHLEVGREYFQHLRRRVASLTART